MKEHPIIFSTPMVQAILNGNKTQTRRVVTSKTSVTGEGGDWSKLCWDGSAIYEYPDIYSYKPIKKEEKAPLLFVDDGFWQKNHSAPMYLHAPYNWQDDMTVYRVYCRYDVGDRLWVKETIVKYISVFDKKLGCFYKASGGLLPRQRWTPAIFMPRWASRITLEITEIRAERLQEITEEDAIKEGIVMKATIVEDNLVNEPTYRDLFVLLWDSINAKRGHPWESNPWVWIISFRRIK